MNNKLAPIIMLPIMLLFAVWMMSQVATMHVFYQTYIVGICVVIIVSLFIIPRVSYDVKLMMFLLLGYSFAGKGFAYISPYEPFYISEVCLAVCMVFFMLRIRSFGPGINGEAKKIWVLLMFLIAAAGFRLAFFDFPEYRILAIRDSATAYYGLYFLMSYLAFDKDANFLAVRKILPWCCVLGLISAILVRFKVHVMIAEAAPLLGRIYLPHDDAYKPLVAALVITLSVMMIHKRNVLLLPFCALSAVVLLLGQTSGVVAVILAYLFLLLTTFRKEFVLLTLFAGFAACVGITLIAISASSGSEDYIGAGHVETFRQLQEFDTSVNNDNTTSWRLGWWTIIWEETMEYSPLFGMGFGADITGEFREVANVQSESRYPHNIAFTVLGRTGLSGLLFFMIFIFWVLLHLRKGAKMLLRGREVDYHFLLAISFVLAGLANGFMQMTYEGPYAAIPHWIVLGYVFSYIKRARQGRLNFNAVSLK